VKEGFMAAWRGGAKKWNEAIAAGAAPGFHPLSEAWKSFPPVGIPGAEAKVTKPSEERLNVAFENAVTRFITGELGPRVKKLLSLMTAGGTEKQHNALGLLYARYGLFAEAKPELKKAAASGYVPALINLGNIAFLEKNYEGAVDYFRRVLEQQPDNKAALVGLARAKYELDLFSESDELFGRVIALDPALAEQYAYLSSRIEGSKSRAASALDRGDVLWSAEEE
jgi:tetratricopeptide (TPR) repeat protein